MPEPDLLTWGLWFEEHANRIVAQEWVENVKISTVFLGLDHNWWPDRPMKIFETMIFGGDLHLEQWRYSTEEEALAGHAETCKLVEIICSASQKEVKNGES